MEGLISLLYWPMMLYNRELLMSHEMVLPLSIDASLHLWPAVLLWLDFLVFDADFQRSRMHVITIYCFTLFYLCWTTYCFSHNGFWPYPFLAEFSTLGRASFYMFCGTACVLMYEAGKCLCSCTREESYYWRMQPVFRCLSSFENPWSHWHCEKGPIITLYETLQK